MWQYGAAMGKHSLDFGDNQHAIAGEKFYCSNIAILKKLYGDGRPDSA